MSQIKIFILDILARFFFRLVWKVISIRVIGSENLDEVSKAGQNYILAFWHGKQFVMLNFFRDREIGILVSLSKDGDLQNRALSNMGYEIFRGSSSRGGIRGLFSLVKYIKTGKDAAFAVDGSRGPKHVAKAGAIYAAKKSNSVIIPVGIRNSKKWTLNNWCNYEIPKPSCKTTVFIGKPFIVSTNDDKETIAYEQAILTETIKLVNEKAEQFSNEQ